MKNKVVTFEAINQLGYKEIINDLYWFEERGVHNIYDPEGLHGEKYIINIYVDGELFFTSNKDYAKIK